MTPISTIQPLISRDALPITLPNPALIQSSDLGTDHASRIRTHESASFADLLGNLVNETNQKQVAASETVHGMLAGENVPLHEAVIAMEEASVSMQLMVEVRNKMLESYQELMRMQL